MPTPTLDVSGTACCNYESITKGVKQLERMQSAGFSNASSQIRNDSLSHFSNVTTATPAKKITFYKSGDSQFSGIRMPIHKRSFKCFDSLLDDLSQKMPLPFGVRMITTPRGTHTIQNLEELQDGACYLCSDRQFVKPIDMEVAGKRPVSWHNSYPINIPKKPSRPEEPPTGHSGHRYHRQPKKIVLVKNNDPSVRRSIFLSKRRVRSLRVFMDEISELMQCHIRKLYTLEGRKIDSMQSLMQCPNVLVCVGREPFKHLLLENLRKSSEEKLPGIGARSHSSIYSEGHDSKKNVNFGLETKKSIIHPRSDSSNKSARFSLSSEKSYPNGSSATPGQLGCVTKEVVMNDDVEKRVLVNKDGSLSVEMKVRFRLVNDETLQWSTEIKKLPISTNDCRSIQEGDPQCLTGKVVYSEPEFNAECEAEEACSLMDFTESHCQSCCNHGQGHDIWKNPLHMDDKSSGTISTSNCAESSERVMHQKESVDSMYTVSRSSKEYTEHVVEKASCFQQTIEKRDTRIEYCSISRCCSQSEASTSATKCNAPTDTFDKNTGKICDHNDNRKTDYAKFEDLSKVTKVEEHLISSTTNSSIIQPFKNDEENDHDDLPPCVLKASQWCSEQNKPFAFVHSYGSQCSQNLHSSSIQHKVSSCSADLLKSKMSKTMYAALEVHQDGLADTDGMDSPRSSVSKVSSRSQCCCCSEHRESTRSLVESHMRRCVKETVQNAIPNDIKVSNKPKARTNSPRTVKSDSGVQKASQQERVSGNRCVMSAMSTICPCCGGCGRLLPTIPADVHDTPDQVSEQDSEDKSLGHRSFKSPGSKRFSKCTHCAPDRDLPFSNILENIEPVQNNTAEVEVRHACQCAMFDLSNNAAASKQSNKSNQHACGRASPVEMDSETAGVEDVEGKTKSAMSIEPVESAKTDNDIADKLTTYGQKSQIAKEINTKKRMSSAMSTKPHSSKDPDKSHKSDIICNTTAASPPTSMASLSPEMRKISQVLSTPKSPVTMENSNQALSVKSGKSSKSTRSNKRHCFCLRDVQGVASSHSTKSLTPASHGQLDEPLSPTLTASASLGLSAEEQSEDLNEQSMINTSQIFDEPKCLLDKYTPEHSALEHAINNSAKTETRERVKTAVSTNSTVSDQTKLSHCMEDSWKNPEDISLAESETIISVKSTTENRVGVQLLENDHRVPSALSVPSGKSQENSTSKNTSTIERCTRGTQAIIKNMDKGETNKALGIKSKSKSSQNKIPHVKATAHMAAISKDQSNTKCKNRSQSNFQIKEDRKAQSNSSTSMISLKTPKSEKKLLPRNKYVTNSNISQNCDTPDSKWKCCTALPHSPDLLRKKDTDARTSDKNYVLEEMQHIHSNCKTSSSFKPRNNSTASLNKAEDNDEPLMPSCLPNASPTDVVNYWLKNIPIVRPLYQMDDEFCEQHDETLPHMPAVKEEGCFQNETGEQSEKPLEMKDSQELGGPEGADPVIEDKNTICYAKLPCNETFQTIVGNSDYSHLSAKITKRESLANNCQSSIQVMKVLLSPKLDRCNSLPEISPTYGIKLSTSAKGLLDCLANLQVFDPDPKIYDKYSEIISTLQSLWSNRPCETVQDKHKTKVYSAEDEFNPRSSSGVDLSSGSIGSGKGSINGGFAKSDTAPGRTTIIAKPKAFPQIQEDAIMRSGCDSLTAMPENINTFIVSSNPITPDIAERVRCSPEHEKLNEEAQEDEGLKATDDVIQTPEPIKDIKVIALTFSQNDGNVKAAADKETNPPENSKLRTPSSDQRSQLTKRISQDPDPVWVLSLLKKLEKQFMSHYANAISEFKVKWDLNDNEMLDIMISELKEEVHKRIQSTISRELQKIQSRAGRTPRPPISILSRDSTMQTEQRRRRLKVMQNKLMTPSKSDEINTASGTEISDQRSEDEYCPCDTCMKKKMPSRVIQCAEAVSMAPVVKDYDLRQILQAKKDSSVTLPMQSKLDVEKHQIGGSDSSNSQGKNPLMMVKEVVITEHGVYACGNPDKHVGLINDAGLRTVKKGLSREEDYGQPEKEKVFDNRVDEADNGRSKTEQEKHKVEEGTDKKNEEEAEEDSEGDIAIENPPNELYAKRKEKESSKTEAGEGNPVEEKESNDERPEEELSAGEANKKSETLEAEEEEKDRIEKKAETPEEGKESENRTGEETKSVKEAKTFEDESEEAENSNVTSDEETQDDAPAAAPEAKPGNNKITKVIEGERTEEFGATQKSEANTTPENSAGEIQSDSTEAENEVGKESHENKGKMYTQKPTKKKDSISAAGQLVSEEEEEEKDKQADCRSVKRIQTDMRARSIENQAEDPGNQSRVYGDESDCNLIKQRTKTSIEFQTGSLEHFKDLTMKEKLQDIQSFMESLSDQDS